MTTNTYKRTKSGSSKLTESRRTHSGTVKTSTTRSYKSGNSRTTINLGTGKTRKTKIW